VRIGTSPEKRPLFFWLGMPVGKTSKSGEPVNVHISVEISLLFLRDDDNTRGKFLDIEVTDFVTMKREYQ
jgi:hypothetical protein